MICNSLWTSNFLVFHLFGFPPRSRRKCLGRGKSERLCLDCCPRNPDKRKIHVCMHVCMLGLCDMDKKDISRFFDFFSDFDFNHDFDTNRHALSYTSYLSCTSCFALFFILLHILLFISLFLTYMCVCSCVVLLLYNFYSLHCPLSGPDLIYISLLIIPCIIYHVTNKETLTFTVINAFCVNLKHISKGNQLDLSKKVVTCL